MTIATETTVFGIPLSTLPARFFDQIAREDYSGVIAWRKELALAGATDETIRRPLPIVVVGYRKREP